MINRVFNSQTKTVTFAAFILAVSGLISRFLALVRDRLIARDFGAGLESDIYFAAFRIPDFVYGILIAGGITAAFLPVFSQYFKEKTEKGKWSQETLEFTNNVLNCFLFLLVAVCAVLAVFTPQIIFFITPGFSQGARVLTTAVTRIMFLSPILFGLSSIFSGILHYFNKFLVYSLAPIFYNVGIIIGILFLVPVFGVFGLAYGVIIGALLHLLIQIPAARNSGYHYKPVLNFRYPGLLKIFKLMVPRTIGSAAYNINLIVITAIASTLTVGSISVFNYSNNLQYFPIGIIGLSFAISAFPVFSQTWTNGQKKEFLTHFSSALRQIVFLIIPVSFLMFLLRAQIVRLILGTGQFDWWETRLTAASLGIFCLGVFASSLIPLLTRAFFALQDTKTPVTIGIISMLINVLFSFYFVYLLGFPNFFKNFLISNLDLFGISDIRVIGLPIAFSLAVSLQLLLLFISLHRKIGRLRLKEIISSSIKILLAGIIMSVFVYFILQISADLVDMQKFQGLFIQTALAGLLGITIYFLAVLFLKSPEIKTIKLSFIKQFIPEEPEELEK